MCKQCRPRSDCSWRSRLIRVYTVCHSIKYFKKQLCKKQTLGQKSMEWSVRNFRTFTVFENSTAGFWQKNSWKFSVPHHTQAVMFFLLFFLQNHMPWITLSEYHSRNLSAKYFKVRLEMLEFCFASISMNKFQSVSQRIIPVKFSQNWLSFKRKYWMQTDKW